MNLIGWPLVAATLWVRMTDVPMTDPTGAFRRLRAAATNAFLVCYHQDMANIHAGTARRYSPVTVELAAALADAGDHRTEVMTVLGVNPDKSSAPKLTEFGQRLADSIKRNAGILDQLRDS